MIQLGPAGLAAAFAAGLVSFVSPCVLPLVPGYLSFVSGVSYDELGSRTRRVSAATGAFVLGFSIVFVLFGAGAAWFGNALLENRRTLEIAAGAFIVLTGLVLAGVPLPLAVLRERRLRPTRRRGPGAAVLVGAAFAVGWTPCIGPTLAAILTLAAAGESPGSGAVLLAVYSLGLGVPFLLFGLGFTRALGLVAAFRRHQRAIGLCSGALLVVFGALLASGELTRALAGLTRFGGIQL
ncbi:MAG: cytochrome c biogenesis protein CcdA [Thermoleophilia bacterium]